MKKIIIFGSILIVLAVCFNYASSQPISPFIIRFLDLIDVTETTLTGEGGNYVRVNAGETGLEFVTLAGGGDFLADGSVPMTGVIDLYDNAAPTTNATGEIALDTTITDHQPLWQYYDGGENMTIIAIDTAELPALDNEIIKYDAGTDKFVLEADAGGGGNDIYVEEGDAAKVDSTGADLYIDFDATDFEVTVVGNEGNITIPDDGHLHTGASVSGIADADVDNNITIDLATLATTVTLSDDDVTNDNQDILFTTDAAGPVNIEADIGDFYYNPSTGLVTAAGFAGSLTGNADTASTAAEGDAAVNFFGAGVTAVTDATAVTDVEGTGLSIAGGTLNWAAASTDLTDTAAIAYVADNLSVFAATTSAQLYGVLSDETGSGAGAFAVFSEYPTLTGLVATSATTNPMVDLNPANTGTANVFDITPSAVLSTNEAEWDGIHIDGTALDPTGTNVTIHGIHVDLGGVVPTGAGTMHLDGVNVTVPVGGDAIHIDEGGIYQGYTTGAAAGAEYTAYDVVVDSSSLHANSMFHAVDVATSGGVPAGDVVGLGTHSYVHPVHQHIGTYSTPDQDLFAGLYEGGDWIDGDNGGAPDDLDGNEIFVVNANWIAVGSAAQFSEIEVIMGTGATRTVIPTFWYSTGAATWTQFYPGDDTNGFQQSGLIRWSLGDITALWTGNGDPSNGEVTPGYWIKIIRTSGPDPGTPTPTTIKTGTVVSYSWDMTGAIDVLSMEADTVTEGGNAVYNSAEVPGGALGGTWATPTIDDLFIKLAGDVVTAGTYDFGEASVILEIPNGTDENTVTAGTVYYDTDGANETSDAIVRGRDGTNQWPVGQKIRTIAIPVNNPDGLTAWAGRANPSQPVWLNTSGMTFTIIEVIAISDVDNYDCTLFESSSQTDVSDESDTSIIALECDADGTEGYTDTEVVAHAVEHDHWIIFEDTLGDAGGVTVIIKGWFNADID